MIEIKSGQCIHIYMYIYIYIYMDITIFDKMELN